jgi:hypothetical protein
MTDLEDRPDPTRQRLLRSVFESSPLESVAEAVSAATEDEQRIYVERLGSRWRWSLTHRGRSYPLLRITARFLRVDHNRIMIGFRTVSDDLCVLCADPDECELADAWKIIDFDGPTSPRDVQERIVQAFGTSSSDE